jgi:uncharacterized small protein (DUF1192 family)
LTTVFPTNKNELLMKNTKIVLICALLLNLVACETFVPVEQTKIVPLRGQLDSSTIYNRVRQWFSLRFVSGESVIDYEDPIAGTIIGNANSYYGSEFMGLIRYKMKYVLRVDTKDNRFRVQYTIEEHLNEDTKSIYSVSLVPEDRIQSAQSHIERLIADLKAFVEKAPEEANW